MGLFQHRFLLQTFLHNVLTRKQTFGFAKTSFLPLCVFTKKCKVPARHQLLSMADNWQKGVWKGIRRWVLWCFSFRISPISW